MEINNYYGLRFAISECQMHGTDHLEISRALYNKLIPKTKRMRPYLIYGNPKVFLWTSKSYSKTIINRLDFWLELWLAGKINAKNKGYFEGIYGNQ